jgi:hypothetical protein
MPHMVDPSWSLLARCAQPEFESEEEESSEEESGEEEEEQPARPTRRAAKAAGRAIRKQAGGGKQRKQPRRGAAPGERVMLGSTGAESSLSPEGGVLCSLLVVPHQNLHAAPLLAQTCVQCGARLWLKARMRGAQATAAVRMKAAASCRAPTRPCPAARATALVGA